MSAELAPSKPSLWSHVPRLVPSGLAIGALSGVLWLVRWLGQGQGTMWTDIGRRFYVPDATVVCAETQDTWVWLGLDGLLVLGGVTLGTLALVPLVRLSAGRGISKVLRFLTLAGAALLFLGPLMPAWAFVSGTPPAEARPLMSECVASASASAPAPGALTTTAKRFVVAESPKANLLTVQINAGNETFDARFATITGTVELMPPKAMLVVQSRSIATGVALRDDHARGYLKVDEHAQVTLALDDVKLAPDGAFTAKGTCTLLGRAVPVDVAGNLVVLDAAKRQELGIEAAEALLASGTFKLSVAATPLDPKNFDSDELVISARVALVPAPPQ